MLNPNQLYGIEQAVNLLVEAYQQQQKISDWLGISMLMVQLAQH
ncbi:ssDNA exonuclease, 5'--_ 3'-specific [Haemophilus influenzae]|uniref:SsDNA exonuclease, 5'--> 3'-specific n=1 Tax=Haemophilus influenzae TaxID=727 RepID=A0A2X1Q1P7_HAEIF|nr:ssDNA exonuclease, 5'--> 3'-specific [Haemophilus influenzae]